MGNLCNGTGSVGVIETTPHPKKIIEPQNESKEEEILEETNNEEVNNDLGTFEFSTNEWRKLIHRLKANKTLETYSLSNKRNQFKNMNELALFLDKGPAADDFERAWLVYMFVTHNIEYDAEGFRTGKFGSQDAESVLKNGKSVCAGYATLFEYLCKKLHLDCIVINGYAKGFGYKMGAKFTEINHAWNALKLNGKWYLLDSTWGAGNVNYNFKFEKEFKPFYFCVPSQVFIYTHFPLKQKTQTIKSISQKEFEELPKIELNFFVLGLSCPNLNKCIINSPVNPFFIEFESEKDTQLIGYLADENSQRLSNTVLTQRDSKSFKHGLIVTLPEKNKKYSLELFARKDVDEDGATKNYLNVGEVVIARTSDDVTKIPNYSIEFDFDIKLTSHFSTLITCNQNPLSLEFSAPLTVTDFKVSLRDSSNNLMNDCAIYQRSVDKRNIELKLILGKKLELYKLEMFALSKFLGYLWVKRDQGDANDSMKFFQIFSGLSECKAHVFSPYDKILKKNHSIMFKVSAENSTNAALVFMEKEWIYMKNESKENAWFVEHTFEQSGPLQMFIMIDKQWKGICGYDVV
jgi:hypothetical protein